MFTYPTLPSPNRSGSRFRKIGRTYTLTALPPADFNNPEGLPKRYFCAPPLQDGTFVKTLKQTVIKDARLSPMTRMMIILLSGWDGAGKGSLTTNIGTIAKHLKRSRRMVFHYLKDAVKFGYLTYSRTKDRMGYYTGIKVFLNFSLIRKEFKKSKLQPTQNTQETKGIRDVKYTAQTKENIFIKQQQDEETMKILARFAVKAGFLNSEPINNSSS